MNDNIICLCYSRTGKTRRVMTEIAAALDCEMVLLRDGVNRQGALGALRSGLDAMRKHTRPISRPVMRRALSDYELVILGTPVWAGRCSSVARALLKRRGYEMQSVAYVITHRSEEQYREVFDQMDKYLLSPHVAEASLCPGATGCAFWRDQFLKAVAERTGVTLRPVADEDAKAGD